MLKKIIIIVTTLTFMLVTSAIAMAKKNSIEFMTATSINSRLYHQYEIITKKFLKSYPGVSINLEPYSADYETEIKSKIAAGNPADMWMTHGWSLRRYADFLVNLKHETWASSLTPALKPIMESPKGDLYALPIDIDVSGLVYNEDVLTKIGVKAEDIKTWTDFNEVSKKLLAKNITPISLAGKDRWPVGILIDWLMPGKLTATDKQNFTQGKFVRPAYDKVFSQVLDFRNKQYLNADFAASTVSNNARALAQGKTGFLFLMDFVTVDAHKYNPQANIQFMPIPNDNGKPYFVVGEQNAIGISNKSDNIDICKKYLSFLAKKENISALANAIGSSAGLSNVQVNLGKLQKSWDKVAHTKTVPFFDRVYMPSGSWDGISATLTGVLTDTISKKDALDKISSDFSYLYKAQK